MNPQTQPFQIDGNQYLVPKQKEQKEPNVEENESPRKRKKVLEKEILDLSIREAIATEKLKELRDQKKKKLELVVQCMNEMGMPLLEIMIGEEGKDK